MNETLKYKILTTIRYLGDAFYYPFIALYLKSCGLIESRIGFLLSLSPLIGILTNPLYTFICKKPAITKKVLGIISILEGIIILLIGFNHTFIPLMVLVIMLAIFGACHYGLMDSLVTLYATTSDTPFSKIRIFGSIAYAVGTTVGGLLIEWVDFKLAFGIATILFIASGIFYLMTKPIEIVDENVERPKYKELLRIKSFYLFGLLFVLLMGTVYASDHFYSVFLETKGIDASGYGLIYTYYVIVECIALFIYSRCKHLKGEVLLLVCGISLFMRQLVNLLPLPTVVIALGSAFRGFFYATFLHVAYLYTEKLVGKRMATIAIMTMSFFQLATIFGLDNLDGVIIENHGYHAYYLLMLFLSSLCILVQIIRMLIRRIKKEEVIEI